jgi:squamous cell carcinoma antigen recognized by T-cells 3
LDGQFHLQAKISDPSKKDDRHGSTYEGREVYVRNVHFVATESEVMELFSRYGTVEKVRVPTNLNGKAKGVAFVVFEDKVSINLQLIDHC